MDSWGYHRREPPSYYHSSTSSVNNASTPREMSSYNPFNPFYSVHSRDTSYRSSAVDSEAPLLPVTPNQQRQGQPALGGEVYDESSRRWALAGILWSFLWAFILGILGGVVWYKASPNSNEIAQHSSWTPNDDYYPDNSQGILVLWNLNVPEWLPKLALNVLVTLCNVATGNVHGTTLKWALIEDGRPGFNANIRLFTAIGGLFGMNGYIANFLHAACLIVSQASVSVVFLPGPKEHQVLIPAVPILAISASLLVQTLLVLVAFWRIPVRTWSSSPLDVAIAARVTNCLGRVERRCLRPAADFRERTDAAVNPQNPQPSAWETHPRVKYIIYLIWVMVFASFLWSYILFALIASDFDADRIRNKCSPQRLLPSGENVVCYVGFTFNHWASVKGELPNNTAIGLNLLLFLMFQGILASALHCCELIITLSRDEDVWRKAASRSGAKHVGNQVYNFWSWKSIMFLTFNPILHWIMGNSLVINQNVTAMYPMQIIWLTVGLAIISILVTVLARWHPRGFQPSAFGHLQTLVDLIDEDSRRFYWGHKSRDDHYLISHAGTSSDRRRVAPIRHGEVYA